MNNNIHESTRISFSRVLPTQVLVLILGYPQQPMSSLQKSRDREKKKRILEESPDVVGYLRYRIEPQSMGPMGSHSVVLKPGIVSPPFPDPLRKSRM
jgi:hypothetical protein